MKTLGKMLEDRCEEEWAKTLTKIAKYQEDVERDLQKLGTAFGSEPVQHLLERDLKGASIVVPVVNKAAKRAAKKPRGASGRGRKRGQLSYTELRPHVVTAVANLAGRPFTKKDVEAQLQEKGVKYNHEYITLMITKDILGVKKIGQQPRSNNGGPKMNLFETTGGAIAIRPSKRATKTTVH